MSKEYINQILSTKDSFLTTFSHPQDIGYLTITRLYLESGNLPDNGWHIYIDALNKANQKYSCTGLHFLTLEESLEWSTNIYNKIQEFGLKVKNIEPSAIKKCLNCNKRFSNVDYPEQMCWGCKSLQKQKDIDDITTDIISQIPNSTVATDKDIADMQLMLSQVASDPNLTIVTHNHCPMGIDFDEKRQQEIDDICEKNDIGFAVIDNYNLQNCDFSDNTFVNATEKINEEYRCSYSDIRSKEPIDINISYNNINIDNCLFYGEFFNEANILDTANIHTEFIPAEFIPEMPCIPKGTTVYI